MTEPSPPGTDSEKEGTTSEQPEQADEAGPSGFAAAATSTDTDAAYASLSQRQDDGAKASTCARAVSPAAIEQLVHKSLRQACNHPWQEFKQISTSLAAAGRSDEFGAVLEELEAEVMRQMKTGDSPKNVQCLSSLLHTFAELGHIPSRELLSVVTEDMRAAFQDFFPQDCVDAAEAYALLDHYPGITICSELAQAFHEQVAHCKPTQLSRFLSAYVNLRHHPGLSLLESALAEALRHLDQYSMEEVSSLMWAGASFGFGGIARLLDPLLLLVKTSTLVCRPKDMARILWSLAAVDMLSEATAAVLGARCVLQELGDFSEEALQQVACAHLALPSLSSQLPPRLSFEVLQALQLRRRSVAEAEPQAAITAVAKLLREHGHAPIDRQQMDDGLLMADICLPASRMVLLLEPPMAFFLNERRQPVGQTILTRRLFTKRNWQVVSVAVSDWNALHSPEQQWRFLQQALFSPSPLTRLPAAAESTPSSSAVGVLLSSLPSGSGSAEGAVNAPLLPAGSGKSGESSEQLNSSALGSMGVAPSLELSSRATGSLLTEGSLRSRQSGPSGLLSSTSSFHELQPDLIAGGLPPLPTPNLPEMLSTQTTSSGRSSQDALPASLQLLGQSLSRTNSAGANLAGTSQPRAQLPSLTGKQMAPNTGAYWEQVALASRLANMSFVPRGPLTVPPLAPGSQALIDGAMLNMGAQGRMHPQDLGAGPSAGAGGLPDLSQKLQMPGQGMQLPGVGPPFQPGASAGYMGLGVPLEMGEAPPLSGRSQGDLRQLWQMVTQVEPGQNLDASSDAVSVVELKRIIELLPLETSAVAAVAPRLAVLDPRKFAALLTELARDNHAFRAWQLFDWVRGLPEDNEMRQLCDSNTYTTMISLCGPWQQVRRALNLVADMRARSLECGVQAYSALLHAAVKCGEVELAIDVYRQMGAEGMAREKMDFQTMVDVFVKMGRHIEALSVLDDMRKAGQAAEVQLYNLIVLACTKLNNQRAALDVYKRMVQDGVQPNTKTFTALIGSVGKLNSLDQAMEMINELLAHEPDSSNLTATYSALMSACEKAGQWDLAVALFDKISAQGARPDVSIFNSMIAACAHGGEYNKARLMFERMAEHGCQADAVTYANLIRAYKKGGQWCHALDTFEAMQRSGCRPHAAVYSSIIDVLWQTGIAWAQAKALRLFTAAVESGSLAAAAESCKKGTLKVDLQALTVGVAVLSMAAWLTSARQALMTDQAAPLDASRKLAVVNGLGEHSRAQGHSAAVKEAVGAGLLGCKAPFRLVQDHSRSGRLEASSLALRKWLFSEAFKAYLSLLQGGPEMVGQPLMSTPEYLELEMKEVAKCQDLFQRIVKYEALHPVSLKVLHSHPGPYLAMRKQLVTLTLHCAAALQLSQETAHTALALMDRCVMGGMQLTDQLHTLMVCACLRVAALQESSFLPSPLAIQALTNLPPMALERMEVNIAASLQNDTECVSAVHCLKIFLQRLGVDLGDGDAVRRAAGCAFALATQALNELPMLQFPPSLSAAAILVAARKAQGSVPFWPSVLAQLTGFTEAGAPAFVSAIGHAERLCAKIISTPEAPFMGAMGL